MAGPNRYGIPDIKTNFPAEFVAHVELNRPKKYNAFSPAVSNNLAVVFDRLSRDEDVRCILLSGAGPHFSAGLDVQAASTSGPVSKPDPNDDVARRAWKIKRHCEDYQNGVNAIERCQKLVYGAAIDLCLAADIRHCSKDVRFSIKEIDIGIAPDIGTLSRLPKVGVSYSWAKEVVVTSSKNELVEEALQLASLIASKSPIAVQGSKTLFDYSRDRSVKDSLEYTAVWASAMVQSEDLTKAMMSGINKTASPKFSKL